jgi:hypothetical protein
MHNERSKKLGISQRKANAVLDERPISGRTGVRGKTIQHFLPTDEFREFAQRVGYAYSTQYNILRGYGAFREDVDYLDEVDPEIKGLVEEEVRKAIEQDAELKKHETLQQEIAQRISIATKERKKQSKRESAARKQQGKTNSKNQKMKKAKNIIDRMISKKQKDKKVDELSSVDLSLPELDSNTEQQWEKESTPVPPKPTTEINPVVAREEIVNTCEKLFRLLTGVQLDTSGTEDPRGVRIGEMQARSVHAKNSMKEIASFYAKLRELAVLQNAVIPTNIALSTFRDFVYESIESEKQKDGLLKP